MLPRLGLLKQGTLDLLFPQWCVGCGREGAFICSSCAATMSRIMPPVCPRCGRPQPSGILCPQCVGLHAALDGIRSPFQFEGVVRDAVHQLKYRNIRAISVPLAGYLCDYLTGNPVPGDVLVPAPLHQKRLKERGYNQANLIAYKLGSLLNLPVVDDCLVRQKYVSPQAGTASVTERRANMVDAFACHNNKLEGKAVIVIDDVATSGATLEACAAALKAGGADSVWGVTLAREI